MSFEDLSCLSKQESIFQQALIASVVDLLHRSTRDSSGQPASSFVLSFAAKRDKQKSVIMENEKKVAVAPATAAESPKITAPVALVPVAPAPTAPAITATPAPAPAENKPKRNRNSHSDAYELKVKKEFISSERPASLGPLPEPVQKVEEPADNRDADRSNKRNRRGKKNKGQNKKRPRDVRPPDSERLCLFLVQGEECPHGVESCKFSHDMENYMRTKPPDLEGIDGGCPGYRLLGFCKYGVCCRFAGSHTTKSGQNLRNEAFKEEDKLPSVQNVMDREVLTQLRKNQYPFVCKRYFDDKKNKKSRDANPPAPTAIDNVKNLFSAPTLPAKERKIIDFRNKVYIAPLTTVGNLPFRRIMKHFQADITCGEMAVATCLLEGRHSEWSLVKRHPCEDVFGVQITAGHADQFTRCAEVLEKHVEMDFVDLNMGCPLDLICNKGAGAQMMMRDKRLKESLIGICNTLSCPVTVKMRTGWDESRPIAHTLVNKIQSWAIPGMPATIFVHGRSRLQRYSKLANWDFISKVATSQSDDFPKIPIVGNGDIFSYTDYEEKVARDGISTTAMLARGALIKPWLPTEIKERRHWDISATERLDILKDFCKFGLEHWGSDQQGVNNTRRFLLEWLSFLHRYTPIGLIEGGVPQQPNQRPPNHMVGRNDLETLFMSTCAYDWVKISEMLLGPVPEGFDFEPKHKASSYRK